MRWSRLLLDVVVGKSSAVLTLSIVDLVGDRLAVQGLDKHLHTTAQTENEVESRLLLGVIVGESSAVFELAFEDKALLVRGYWQAMISNLRFK
jgi:hypothetical protein